MKKMTILFATLMLLSGCSQKPQEVKFEEYDLRGDTTKLTVEYGSTVNLVDYAHILECGVAPLEYPEVSTDEVGSQELTLIAKLNQVEVKVEIEVEDTQKPVISGVSEVSYFVDETLDLNTIVKAKDPVDGDLEITFSEYEKTVGTHTVTAAAKDKHDNESTHEITVTVKERPVVVTPKPTPQPPATTNKPGTPNKPSGGGGNTSGGGNTGGGSGNTGGGSGNTGGGSGSSFGQRTNLNIKLNHGMSVSYKVAFSDDNSVVYYFASPNGAQTSAWAHKPYSFSGHEGTSEEIQEIIDYMLTQGW